MRDIGDWFEFLVYIELLLEGDKLMLFGIYGSRVKLFYG